MANINRLYRYRQPEEVLLLLARAASLAKQKTDIHRVDLQSELGVGYEDSVIILDWLVDQYDADTKISNHAVRSGRAYVLNAPFPSLAGMAEALRMGEQRAQKVMQVLVERNIIRIKEDYTFERVGRMSSFDDLVGQMKVVARKYRNRCEPMLLVRFLYVDPTTALRLAQYGEEHLGLRWKDRPSELM